MNAHPSRIEQPGPEHEHVQPPFNIEAEQALLGALLLNNQVADMLPGLNPEHFSLPVHGRIYALVMRLIAAGKRADAVVLKSLLADDAGVVELGGTRYIADLVGAAISIVAAPQYAELIIDLARRGRQMAALQQAIADLPTAEDPDEVFAELESNLATGEEDGVRQSGVSLSRAMETAFEGMNEVT